MTEYVAQEGGTHYEAASAGLQHWDLMEKHDIAYLEACATKYIGRRRKKGVELLDLRKARSYLQKMAGRPTRRHLPADELLMYVTANGLDIAEINLTTLILHPTYGRPEDIAEAIDVLDEMIENLEEQGG